MFAGGNWQVINSEEKQITRIDVVYRGGIDIDVENDIIMVLTTRDDCDYFYKYDLKINKKLKKSESCY